MKTPSIVGVVIGLHILVIGFVILVPGCGKSTQVYRPEPTTLLPPRRVAVGPAAMSPVGSVNPVPTGELKTYVVKKGDMLSRIAQNSGVRVRDILAVNDLADPDVLFIGQKLLLPSMSGPVSAGRPPAKRPRNIKPPAGGELYIVKRGDCLSKIAVRHGMTVKELRDVNELTTDMIRVGQKMIVSKRRSDGGESNLDDLLDDPSEPVETGGDLELPSPEPDASDSAGDPVTDFYSHEVQEGETLEKVAQLYLVSQARLMAVNNLSSAKIRVGMTLKIPQSD